SASPPSIGKSSPMLRLRLIIFEMVHIPDVAARTGAGASAATSGRITAKTFLRIGPLRSVERELRARALHLDRLARDHVADLDRRRAAARGELREIEPLLGDEGHREPLLRLLQDERPRYRRAGAPRALLAGEHEDRRAVRVDDLPRLLAAEVGGVDV